MLRSTSLFILLFVFVIRLIGQPWVDTLYQIETIEDILYGQAVDFAGNQCSLMLDVSYPTNDSLPECGRPLLVAIHGGGFIDGSKSEGLAPLLRLDFAKRGYTTASINYRLGLFQTHQPVHCNISNFGIQWDCLNMADTSEWYRAYYRGIQDAHTAIRYLVNHAEEYQIDPQQIYVVGESAGAFIAMGVGFINDTSEVKSNLVSTLPTVQIPNAIYEAPCIQGFGLDTAISSLNLERPDLGPYRGTSNNPLETEYTIRGIGAFYGAVFNNIFHDHGEEHPALYLFHQPADLIVPFNKNRIFAGFAFCATQFPAFCQYIINRPFVCGSNAIVNALNEMEVNGYPIPNYLFEHNNNNANCAQQIIDPNLQAHSLDNYWLRTTNMASLFASEMGACTIVSNSENTRQKPQIQLYPNPVKKDGMLSIHLLNINQNCQLQLHDTNGKLIKQLELGRQPGLFQLNLTNLKSGLYIISIKGKTHFYTEKILAH